MWYETEHNVMYSVCIITSHCDLSVLAVSLMEKDWIGFELYPIFFGIITIF